MRIGQLFQIVLLIAAGSVVASFSLFSEGSSTSSLPFLQGSTQISDFGQWTQSYFRNPEGNSVAIFQRWSLAESVDSKNDRNARYPMQESENELLRALALYVPTLPAHSLILTDLCAGPISSTHKTNRNGWGFSELEREINSPGFSMIPTFLPWKIEMIFGKSNPVICAEDAEQLDQQHVLFQNVRNDLGEIDHEKNFGRRSLLIRKFRLDLVSFEHNIELRSETLLSRIKLFSNRNLVVISHSSLNHHLIENMKNENLNFNIFETKDFRPMAADAELLLGQALKKLELSTKL